jgi:hypothetical protein
MATRKLAGISGRPSQDEILLATQNRDVNTETQEMN